MPMLKSSKGSFLGTTTIGGVTALIVLSLSSTRGEAQTAAMLSTPQVPEWQKTASGKLSFDVASIELADPDNFTSPNFALNSQDWFAPDSDPTAASSLNFHWEMYIYFAYKLANYPRRQRDAMLAHAPTWVSTDRYTTNAVAEGNPAKDQMRLMLQSYSSLRHGQDDILS